MRVIVDVNSGAHLGATRGQTELALLVHGPDTRLDDLVDRSLYSYGISVLNKLRKEGVIPLPRYGEMSPYELRLSKTKYKGLDGRLAVQKLLLHLDGYLNTVQRTVVLLGRTFSFLPFSACLNLLRISLREIMGVNPPRFRYIRNVPDADQETDQQRVERLTLLANLELNRILGGDIEDGPNYIVDENDIDLHSILGVEIPTVESRNLINSYEVNLTRKRLGYAPKWKRGVVCSEADYLTYKACVRRYQFVLDRVRPEVVRPLIEWRRDYENRVAFQDWRPFELMLKARRYVNHLLHHDFNRDESHTIMVGMGLSKPQSYDGVGPTVAEKLPSIGSMLDSRSGVPNCWPPNTNNMWSELDDDSLSSRAREYKASLATPQGVSPDSSGEDSEEPAVNKTAPVLQMEGKAGNIIYRPAASAAFSEVISAEQLREIAISENSVHVIVEQMLLRPSAREALELLQGHKVKLPRDFTISREVRERFFSSHGMTMGHPKDEEDFLVYLRWITLGIMEASESSILVAQETSTSSAIIRGAGGKATARLPFVCTERWDTLDPRF